MLIVDNQSEPRTVHVFNPWKQGQARSGIVTRVVDIRPRLVKDLVARYKGFKKFHLSGDQVWTSDCRIRVAKFAKKQKNWVPTVPKESVINQYSIGLKFETQ